MIARGSVLHARGHGERLGVSRRIGYLAQKAIRVDGQTRGLSELRDDRDWMLGVVPLDGRHIAARVSNGDKNSGGVVAKLILQSAGLGP